MRNNLLVLSCLFLLSIPIQATALDCERLSPNASFKHDIHTDLKGTASAIFKLGAINGEAMNKITKEVHGVVNEHKDANITIVKNNILYLFCEILDEDKDLSTEQKIARYFEVLAVIEKYSLPPANKMLDKSEPTLQTAPDKPEPTLQTAPDKPEPTVQTTPDKPEPTLQTAPDKPEPTLQTAPDKFKSANQNHTDLTSKDQEKFTNNDIDISMLRKAKEKAEKKIEALEPVAYRILKRSYGTTNASSYKIDNKNINIKGTYTGALKEGVKDFCGIEKYKNQSFYVGWFKDGERHSFGILYNHPEKTYYLKEFSNGEQIASREAQEITIAGRKYIGEFNNKSPDGRNIVIYQNRDVYLGRYNNGRRTGDGCYFEISSNKINIYTYSPPDKKIASQVID